MNSFAGRGKGCASLSTQISALDISVPGSATVEICAFKATARYLPARLLAVLAVMLFAVPVMPYAPALAQVTKDERRARAISTARKAAQLYQDARYDYSMGYLNAAARNLEELIKRYPYSPFARQGIKDLKMLYAKMKLRRRRQDRSARSSDTQIVQGVSSDRGDGAYDVGLDDNEDDSLSPHHENDNFANTGSNGAKSGSEDSTGTAVSQDRVKATRQAGAAQGDGWTARVTRSDTGGGGTDASSSGGEYRTAAGPPIGPNRMGTAEGEQMQQAGRMPQVQSRNITERAKGAAQLATPAPVLSRKPRPKRYSAALIRRFNSVFKVASSDRIFFPANVVKLGAREREVITSQAQWLLRHPTLTVTISGHADDGGSARKDVEVSRLRAEAVRDYLISEGIDPSRIKIVAHGRTKRIAICSNSVCAAQNRRVVTNITSR